MKFIINTTNLQSGGALQVALSLLAEWNFTGHKHIFHIFLSPQLSKLVMLNDFAANFTFYHFTQNPTTTTWHAFTFYKKLKAMEESICPDAVFTVFGPALWQPRKPHLAGFANGYYLFNQSDFIQQNVLPRLSQRIKYFSRRTLLFRQLKKEANAYWVETKEAQDALSKTINVPLTNISVVGNTYSSTFKQRYENTRFYKKEQFTLLYLSAYYPHKNFEIIPELLLILKEREIKCKFMLTLPQDKFEELFGHNYEKDYLENTGPVNPKDIHELYGRADAVFMPSLLETFSANYPEAMSAGKPILTSNFSFAQQVCGKAALYFNAQDAQDIAEKITALISSPLLRQQLVTTGYGQLKQLESPNSRAEKLLMLLEHIAISKTIAE